MRIFRRNEEAVSPVIGVILMVAITVILAAVIAAFVFGLGGSQSAAPTASIVASNNPDTTNVVDMKIQHKGGDALKGGDWKLSIVPNGQSPSFVLSATGADLTVGSQIITHNVTTAGLWSATNDPGVNVTASAVRYGNATATGDTWVQNEKYDVKLVHAPSNAMLIDIVIEVR